jgi:hypothetical protein
MRHNDQSGNYSTEQINDYYSCFRKRVFTLLFVGYSQVRKEGNDLSCSKEDDITARIFTAIEKYLDDKESPKWSIPFEVHEQRPHSPHGEVGNQRKKLDIFIKGGDRNIEKIQFVFETKRLNKITREDDYFGNKGMQRFLSGNYPINTYREAAMIGYMQNKDIQYWKDWLERHFYAKKIEYKQSTIINELQVTFRTCHNQILGEQIILFHVLLDFV